VHSMALDHMRVFARPQYIGESANDFVAQSPL
jgi:hypothetical protein